MIYELAQDFAAVIAAMPRGHVKYPMLPLLEEILRRDMHFIARRRTTLFQCVWNKGAWYQHPDEHLHYQDADDIRSEAATDGSRILPQLLDAWRQLKQDEFPGCYWVRAIRPPQLRLASAQRIAIYPRFEEPHKKLSFSRNGDRICGGSDHQLAMWDTRSGALVSVEKLPDTRLMDFTHHWDQLLVSRAGTVEILRADLRIPLVGHEPRLETAAMSPDGRRIVTSHRDPIRGIWVAGDPPERCGFTRIWNAENGQLVAQLDRDMTEVNSAEFSPDNRYLALNTGFRIEVWDCESLREVARLGGFEGSITDFAFSPAGKWMAASSQDKTVRVWEMDGLIERQCLAHLAEVNCLTFSADDTRLVTGTGKFAGSLGGDHSDRSIYVWDTTTWEWMARFQGHPVHVRSVAISPDHRWVASQTPDSTIRIWDMHASSRSVQLRNHRLFVSGMYFSSGQHLVTASLDKTIAGWDVTTGIRCWVKQFEASQHEVKIASDNRVFAVWPAALSLLLNRAESQAEMWIKVCDLATGDERFEFRAGQQDIECVAFSADSDWLAAGTGQGTVYTWPIDRRHRLHASSRCVLHGHEGKVVDLYFSNDGQRLVTLSEDRSCRVWDHNQGRLVETIPTSNVPTRLAISAGDDGHTASFTAGETVIQTTRSRRTVGWFEEREAITKHPGLPIWSTMHNNQLDLFQLEGPPQVETAGKALAEPPVPEENSSDRFESRLFCHRCGGTISRGPTAEPCPRCGIRLPDDDATRTSCPVCQSSVMFCWNYCVCCGSQQPR